MPSNVFIGAGIGADGPDVTVLGSADGAPGNSCFIPMGGGSSSSGRMKSFLCASLIVCGRFLTSSRNCDGPTTSPRRILNPKEGCSVVPARLNTAKAAPTAQNPNAAMMRGLSRPDWDWGLLRIVYPVL